MVHLPNGSLACWERSKLRENSRRWRNKTLPHGQRRHPDREPEIPRESAWGDRISSHYQRRREDWRTGRRLQVWKSWRVVKHIWRIDNGQTLGYISACWVCGRPDPHVKRRPIPRTISAMDAVGGQVFSVKQAAPCDSCGQFTNLRHIRHKFTPQTASFLRRRRG